MAGKKSKTGASGAHQETVLEARVRVRLAHLVKARGLTQRGLAKRMTRQAAAQVNKIVNGVQRIGLRHVDIYADALEVDPMLLIAPDRSVGLLEAWDKCDPEERKVFLRSIRRAAGMSIEAEPEPPAASGLMSARTARQQASRTGRR